MGAFDLKHFGLFVYFREIRTREFEVGALTHSALEVRGNKGDSEEGFGKFCVFACTLFV